MSSREGNATRPFSKSLCLPHPVVPAEDAKILTCLPEPLPAFYQAPSIIPSPSAMYFCTLKEIPFPNEFREGYRKKQGPLEIRCSLRKTVKQYEHASGKGETETSSLKVLAI